MWVRKNSSVKRENRQQPANQKNYQNDVSNEDCFGPWQKWKQIRKDIDNVELQLADHYDYATWLCGRMCNFPWMRDAVESMGERLDWLAARATIHEEDARDALTILDDARDVIRYGLMECGGFKHETVSAAQSNHMFIQERTNSVLWNHQRNQAQDTDMTANGEGGEEETLTEHEELPSTARHFQF